MTDIIGQSFGRLKVIKATRKSKTKKQYYLCECSCGNTKEIQRANLLTGDSVSCGCYKLEIVTKRLTKHNKCYSSEYHSWSNMLKRCLNSSDPSYRLYGGRGISIYPEWINSFESFIAYMGNKPSNKHSLDRINVNGNYEPGNVRWADSFTQQNNKRNTVKLTFNGETLSLNEWSKKVNINRRTLASRYGRKWTAKEILTTPTS